MKSAKKARLEAAGWKVASAEDFLGLSRAEALYVAVKLALARKLRERRQRRERSKTQLAKVLGSSQSRGTALRATRR
jgi:hypothetical protein